MAGGDGRQRRPRSRPRAPHRPPGAGGGPPAARERFLAADAYRVEREWLRYEGTAQRDLFRELRERFLARHGLDSPWAVDVGSGPGRFTPRVGGPSSRVLLLDLSTGMLRSATARLSKDPVRSGAYRFLRADAARPPLRLGSFGEVVALGNPLGFSGLEAERFLDSVLPLVAPGGRLLLEYVAGRGERARYFARLPPGAVRRTLAAPLNLVRARVEREGFRLEPPLSRDHGFRRFAPGEIDERLVQGGFTVRDALAVAPALGADPIRIAAVRTEPAAWRHLLELEEALGGLEVHRRPAAAVLVAAERGR